jgi:hypothetical protein
MKLDLNYLHPLELTWEYWDNLAYREYLSIFNVCNRNLLAHRCTRERNHEGPHICVAMEISNKHEDLFLTQFPYYEIVIKERECLI